MKIKKIPHDFSICKVADYSKVNTAAEYCFTGKTDEENSLVCLTADVPDNTLERDDGWRAFLLIHEKKKTDPPWTDRGSLSTALSSVRRDPFAKRKAGL